MFCQGIVVHAVGCFPRSTFNFRYRRQVYLSRHILDEPTRRRELCIMQFRHHCVGQGTRFA